MQSISTFHDEHKLINVKCVLYSVDSTASQQPASTQLQDSEDTSNDYIYG